MPSPISLRIAKAFHETYERLAPVFSYKTRTASAVPWEQVPSSNKELMIAVVGDLRVKGVIRPGVSGYEPMLALEEWHTAIGQKKFVDLDDAERINLLTLRLTLIEEEFKEVREELEAGIDQNGNLTRLAKELGDLLVVVYGTAEVMDIPLPEVFNVVHENNMTKIDPETGAVKRRKDGKIEKPDGYKSITDDEINEILMLV